MGRPAVTISYAAAKQRRYRARAKRGLTSFRVALDLNAHRLESALVAAGLLSEEDAEHADRDYMRLLLSRVMFGLVEEWIARFESKQDEWTGLASAQIAKCP